MLPFQVHITNPSNGRMTCYSLPELLRVARLACKGRGKLEGYWVSFTERGNCRLIVQYQEPSGRSTQTTVSI
jgi:hypothetical protein